MIPAEVRWIWTVLLVLVVIALPLVVSALHRLWWAARNIERYMSDMAAAGGGIGGNTVHLAGLEDTISTATKILERAGQINQHAGTIRTTLADRAAGTPESGGDR